EAEVAGAREHVAVAGADHEEAVALDRQVGRPARALDVALGERGADVADARAETDLAGAAAATLRREQIRELRPASLEADRVHVRDVVADHAESGTSRDESAPCRTE